MRGSSRRSVVGSGIVVSESVPLPYIFCMLVMSSWCSVAEFGPVCLLKVQYMFASGLFECGSPRV